MPDQIAIPDAFPYPGAVAGKRVVITGASRGLGTLLAHAFSRAGAPVALVARTERDLKVVAADLEGPSLVLAGDVTDEDFNEAVADAVVAEWGGLDVWIANAGSRRSWQGLEPRTPRCGARCSRSTSRGRSSGRGRPPGSWSTAAGSSSPGRSWANGPAGASAPTAHRRPA